MRKRDFIVLGGDQRNSKLVDLLCKDGHNVLNLVESSIQVEEFGEHEIVIGPLPFSNDNKTLNTPFYSEKLPIEEIFKAFRSTENKRFFIAGKIGEEHILKAKDYGVNLIDYFNREELQVLNAIPTAEGAIKLAMEYLPITIYDSNVLILGFGRIGKILAKMLYGIGANVYVVARKYSDIAWIKSFGYNPVLINGLDVNVNNMDVIFNTIPAVVITKDTLNHLTKESLIIDLASKPGGVDFNAAKDLGITTIHALGLPGKYAPVSAAKVIMDTIYNIIAERGI